MYEILVKISILLLSVTLILGNTPIDIQNAINTTKNNQVTSTSISQLTNNNRMISFETMVTEIAQFNGVNEAIVRNNFIEEKVNEVLIQKQLEGHFEFDRQQTSSDYTKIFEIRQEEIISLSSSVVYSKSEQPITLQKYIFPYGNVNFTPTIIFYYEASDNYDIKKILNVSLNSNNSSNAQQAYKSLVFGGNIFYHLQDSTHLYYEINGDFYESGKTSINFPGSIQVGESGIVSLYADLTKNHFGYMYNSDTLSRFTRLD